MNTPKDAINVLLKSDLDGLLLNNFFIFEKIIMNFILSRLWRYLNIYFLKPFDAVNDTLTSYLIYKVHKLKNNYLELGSGDGMFSFIMAEVNFLFTLTGI